MKWIGQHIYDLVARFRNDVYLEDLSTTTETNVLVVDSTGKVSKTTVITGDVTGVTAGSNITVTDPTGPVPTVALSTNVDITGTLDVTSLGTFDASVTVAGKISLKDAGDSIFVGYEAGLNDDASANLNVGVGYQALRANTTGANNSAHGYRALYSNTTGAYNTATGTSALRFNTTGANNTATGINALYSNTTANNNTATGLEALRQNTTGANNTAYGFKALRSNTTGANNSAVGYQALHNNTTGTSNSAVGRDALYSNTTGNNNTPVGIYSSWKNTTGTGNAALGYAALYENTTGGSNTAIGREAGRFIADGTTANTVTSNSVFLGYNTKALADSQTNQIVIGDSAVGLGSNTAILGNSSITKTQLQGNVGIGTDSPGYKLSVAGTIQSNAGTITGYPLLEQLRMMYDQDGNYWKFETTAGPGADLLISQNATPFLVVKSGSGRVGIGTTSPGSKLQVYTGNTANANDGITLMRGAGLDVFGIKHRSNASGIYRGAITYDAAEVMTFLITGNVGIGVTDPDEKLEVNGHIKVEGLSPRIKINGGVGGGGIPGLELYENGTRKWLWYNRNTNDSFNVKNDTTDFLTILQSGNVGIGTTAPGNKLSVFTGAGGNTSGFSVGSGQGLLNIWGGAVSDLVFDVTNGTLNGGTGTNLLIRQGGTNVMTITANGNVGIGTTSPSTKLHIAGVNGEAFRWSNSSTVYGKLSCGTAGARIDVTGANSGYGLSFSMDDSTKMIILPSGNVGIGTASPQNKLDIVGSLGRGAPVTKTTDFTVAATENWLIMNGTATITITLPTASSFTGRELMIKNIAAYTVISASSNVKPIDTDIAATAILPATAGSWCTLVSDGTNWVTMMN
jgi:phage gp36-like protein